MKLGNLKLDENDADDIIEELNGKTKELSEDVKKRLKKLLTEKNLLNTKRKFKTNGTQKTKNGMENVKMNELNINQFKMELEKRFNDAESHSEKYDCLEAVKHTLSFLKVDNEELDQMLYELHEKVNAEHKAEYGM